MKISTKKAIKRKAINAAARAVASKIAAPKSEQQASPGHSLWEVKGQSGKGYSIGVFGFENDQQFSKALHDRYDD